MLIETIKLAIHNGIRSTEPNDFRDIGKQSNMYRGVLAVPSYKMLAKDESGMLDFNMPAALFLQNISVISFNIQHVLGPGCRH